jgi:hypothetical protein
LRYRLGQCDEILSNLSQITIWSQIKKLNK